MRVLFVVNRCKKNQMYYVRSIAPHLERSEVIVTYVADPFVLQRGLLQPSELLPSVTVLHEDERRESEIDMHRFRREVAEAVVRLRPDVVHCLYYYHDELVLTVREVLGELGHRAKVVYETRDPSGIGKRELPEREALQAADGFIFASEAIRDYLFARHLVDLGPHIVVRQSEYLSARDDEPEKLSRADGRAHVALIGTFSDNPDSGRHYESYIRAFVANTHDTVLHTFSHLPMDYLVRLESELAGRLVDHRNDRPYPGHPDPARRAYTSTLGRLDFNLVAHSLYRRLNERDMLRVCNPTKATSPLVLADLPLLCLPHYRGVVEIIDHYGCGHVYRSWRDLDRLLADPSRWPPLIEGARAAARDLCHESQSPRIVDFYGQLPSRCQVP